MTAPTTTRGETLVRRYYACVDAGDVDGLVALFQPDAVYRRPGYPPMHGHGDLRTQPPLVAHGIDSRRRGRSR